MNARYLLVRGVPGKLVAHPYAESRRYLGKMPHGVSWEGAKPANEIIRDDGGGYLRKMIRNGGLVLVAECVAASAEDAEKQLAATPQEK